jgi:thioredoxin-related protein
MKRSVAFLMLVVAASAAFAQTPKSAADLVAQARKEAATSNKAVFVRFTASWCGWCHRMQAVIDTPAIKPIWDKYFVSVPIVVLENGEKEKLENSGGEALMEAQGGKGQGIPFFYFVNAKTGQTMVNSMMPAAEGKKATNVGCPYAPEEIAHFMTVLAKAAPTMTTKERSTIEEGFKALSKKG